MTDYQEIKKELEKNIEGEIFDAPEVLQSYSRDASIFEVWPKLVIWPKNSEDVKKIVKFIQAKKSTDPKKYSNLSVTVRAAGSCMSGGPLNESIILDVTKHLNNFSVDPVSKTAETEPGVFYRDFEKETLKHDLILPCYTASKNLCALGGMIGNNAAGEKTLQYGNMENFVQELKIVLADGEEYTIKPLTRAEMLQKSHEPDYLGDIYENISNLIGSNQKLLEEAKPKVSKNAAGYYLWNVEKNGIFDLNKLLVGSQGTLGIVTSAKIKLEKTKPESNMLVILMDSLENLGELVNVVLKYKPGSVESFDRATLRLALRFLPEIIKNMKFSFLKLLTKFWPEIKMAVTGKIPELIIIVEFTGQNRKEIDENINNLKKELENFRHRIYITKDKTEVEKYWAVRRESFNLLRKHTKNRRTAPFIDDICVEPKYLPEFLPKLRKILDEAKLIYTIAGHAGNGNFHIIPLMNFKDNHDRALIPIISEKVFDLVKTYHGSTSGEHNDGIIRTPYLNKMYSPEILDLFKKTKEIFDPHNIFNPGKKVPNSELKNGIGTIEYIVGHLAKS